MHKIAAKEFTLEDFSHEHLSNFSSHPEKVLDPLSILKSTIVTLNSCRHEYLETKDKFFWWQMIQLLPVMLNYEVLVDIYKYCKNNELDEWAEHEPGWELDIAKPWDFGFCDWIKTLPYSELITMEKVDSKELKKIEEKSDNESRKFIRFGDYIKQGFIDGLVDNT